MLTSRHIYRSWAKVLEVVMVAGCTATLGFTMIYFLTDCKPLGEDPTKYPIQMYCGDGEYSAIGAIWFQTPESSVRSFFHDPPSEISLQYIHLMFEPITRSNCFIPFLQILTNCHLSSYFLHSIFSYHAGLTVCQSQVGCSYQRS